MIRLDLRANRDGKLFVLEANPKPDLKKPEKNVTSLIGAGLAAVGMEYDDLILSLLADRMHFLFTHRPKAVEHIAELMEVPTLFDLMGQPARPPEMNESAALICERATNLNVSALKTALAAAKRREEKVDYREFASKPMKTRKR